MPNLTDIQRYQMLKALGDVEVAKQICDLIDEKLDSTELDEALTELDTAITWETDGEHRIGGLGENRPKAALIESYLNVGDASQNATESESVYDGFFQVGSKPASQEDEFPNTVFFAGAGGEGEAVPQFGFIEQEDAETLVYSYFQLESDGTWTWYSNDAPRITLGGTGDLGLSTGTLNLSQTTAAAAGALTLANGPTGVSGDPDGYLTVKVSGVDAVVPYWLL
jgi:hypothetical protein